MKIINPLYDYAFKYLMDDAAIAKTVLSIFLNDKVVSVQSKPQETPLIRDGVPYTSRFDFKAIVQLANSSNKEVLIEVQKYKYPDPKMRFRRYISDNYAKEETYLDKDGKSVTSSLPIFVIYILGYKAIKKNLSVIKIDNTPKNPFVLVSEDIDSEFTDMVTHPCLIIQSNVKPDVEYGTILEDLAKIFVQKDEKAPPNFLIEVEEEDKYEDIKKIKQHLHKATIEEEILRSLTAEREYYDSFVKIEDDLDKERRLKEEAQQKAEEAQQKAKKERKQKEEERRQKESALQKIENTIIKIYKKGFTEKEISEDMEITEQEIKKIIDKSITNITI